MIDYQTTTLNKQGTVIKEDVTYNVNVTVENNEFTRLTACHIKVFQDIREEVLVGIQ